MPKLQQLPSGSYFVTIPKELILKLKWIPGDRLVITEYAPQKLNMEKL